MDDNIKRPRTGKNIKAKVAFAQLELNRLKSLGKIRTKES